MIRPDRLATYLSLAIILVAAAFSVFAQPTPYTKADITKGTTCGASGIGEVWGGPRRGQIEYRDGVPGVRVNESGLWAKGCKMPPIPKDCPETEVPPWPGKDGALCTPARLAPLRARNVGQEWSTQTTGFPYPTPGSRGESRWRCERQPDGSAKWVMLWSICHN